MRVSFDMHNEKEYVRFDFAPDSPDVTHREATDADRHKYKEEYSAFKTAPAGGVRKEDAPPQTPQPESSVEPPPSLREVQAEFTEATDEPEGEKTTFFRKSRKGK